MLEWRVLISQYWHVSSFFVHGVLENFGKTPQPACTWIDRRECVTSVRTTRHARYRSIDGRDDIDHAVAALVLLGAVFFFVRVAYRSSLCLADPAVRSSTAMQHTSCNAHACTPLAGWALD
jgi:hypothetical protein